MAHKSDSVGALSAILCQACMLCMAAYWFSGEIRAGLVFPQVLMLLAPALYGANRLFLRRQRSLRALVLANLALCVACFLGLALSIGPDERVTLAVAAALCAFLTVQAARLAITPPALSRVILCLDASLVALTLFVAYAASAQIPAYQMLPAAVGCAGSLLGLMVCRTGGNLGARGWLFAAAVFGLILLCVLLLWALVAAPVGQGVVAVFGALSAAARFLCALLARAAAWFVSLFPEEATGGLEWEQDMGGLPQVQAEAQQAPQASPAAMAAVGLVLLAAVVLLVAWGLYLLGRIRLGGTDAVAPGGPARTRMSLTQGLRRLFASFAAYVGMRVWLFQNRNTPKGLYYLLVRRCRLGPWHKRRGETPREFLLRLRQSAGEDAPLQAALDALIPAVDAALYAPSMPNARLSDARLIRRRMGASVRGRMIRDGLGRLPFAKGRAKGAGEKSA